MTDKSVKDELLIRYALGRLSATELERVEQRLFSDRDFFQQLLVVEDELIDAYAGGRLGKDDRRRFQRYLLQNKDDRERVEFARQLAEVISKQTVAARVEVRQSQLAAWTSSLRNRLSLVLIAVMILLVLGGSWLVFQTFRLNKQLNQLEADRIAAYERARELDQRVADEREQNRQLSEKLERERAVRTEDQGRPQPQSSSPSFVSLILNPGAVRDRGAATILTLPLDAKRVRIQARFKTGAYDTYRAELQTVEGRSLWRRSGLKSRPAVDGRAVSVSMPASLFREDDYILVLSGATRAGEEEIVAEYFFRVQKK